MTGEYTPGLERNLVSMRKQYAALIEDGRQWSLRELFGTPDCDIVDYCRDFRPNRFGDEACLQVEVFCRDHGIWLESNGEHYNSMTPYLHPGAITAERMAIIGIFNAILFWLNDTAGREKFAHLSPAEQQRAEATVGQMCRLLESPSPQDDADPVLSATAVWLTMVVPRADPIWLERFLRSTIDHLRVAIRDQNARARGVLLGVDGYIALRSHVSGMYPAIALCEFGRDEYLPWDRIAETDLAGDLYRLRVLTAWIGALMNDVFSFEKECITDLADFNLIPIIMLNTPGMTLSDAVETGAHLVRNLFIEFRETHDRLGNDLALLSDADVAGAVSRHVQDLACCVQATWQWEIVTQRYKGASIFAENHPDGPMGG